MKMESLPSTAETVAGKCSQGRGTVPQHLPSSLWALLGFLAPFSTRRLKEGRQWLNPSQE